MAERPKMGRRPVFPEKRPEAIAAYVKGATLQSIANKIGVSSATVSNWMRDAGVRRPSRTPAETVAQAVADYAAGMSTVEVAKKHGVARSSVLRWLKEAGPPRGTAPVPQPAGHSSSV